MVGRTEKDRWVSGESDTGFRCWEKFRPIVVAARRSLRAAPRTAAIEARARERHRHWSVGDSLKALDARPPISGADIAEQSLNKKAPVDTIRYIGRYSMGRQMIVRALVAASLCRQR